MSLLDRFFSKLIREGPLTVIDSAGRERSYGRPRSGGAPVAIRLADRATEGRILVNPALAFGEAFMDGRLTIEKGDMRDLADLIGFNLRWEKENPVRSGLWRPARIGAALNAWNPRARSRRNAARHYDLPDRLFSLFLDEQRQYSCAYFAQPGFSLDQAQAAKMAHIAAKLRLERGQSVLDIGCGWGGLALFLARCADVEVTGITLSKAQLAGARAAAEAAGMADRVRFELADWRDVRGSFDRIVSVGMFEHVGPPHHARFLARCRDLLTDEGVMLLHTIGRADGPAPTDPWLAKYIFPGGYVPALSQIAPAIERSFLWLTDLEVWRDHYARTLDCWYERTRAAGAEIAALQGERFLRMWLFYLAGGIAAFTHDGHLVFQLQLARRRDTLPQTRDYMAEEEARLLEP